MKKNSILPVFILAVLLATQYGKVSDNQYLKPDTLAAKQDFAQAKPLITSHFSADKPAPSQATLTWTVVTGAVLYEIEFLSASPEKRNSDEPSVHRVYVSRNIFTNGYHADFAALPESLLYWRVRALDYDGNPIGVFSDAAPLFIDRNKKAIPRPFITSHFSSEYPYAPLYPVYSWIPITGAVKYEVELTDSLPENRDNAEPSQHRIWSKQDTGFACYDEQARIQAGTYYWRVRGLDAGGNPIGIWSEAGTLLVNVKPPVYAATLGDSITHGGGAVSYSPADLDYSYQSYLAFPVVNLGRSGDTAQTTLARFETDVLPFKPKFLIIMSGTNSIRGGVPAEDVIHDLTQIRNKCIYYGIRPIFLTLPPINPSNIEKVFNEKTAPSWRTGLDAVNRFIRKQRYFIDIEPYFSDASGELPDRFAVDGLHLDIEGKLLIGQLINTNWTRVTR